MDQNQIRVSKSSEQINFSQKVHHGSIDSIDLDIVYILTKPLPDFETCKLFCSKDKTENRNIVFVDPNEGIVKDCFKGIPDEINNSLLHTFKNHKQNFEENEFLIKKKVARNVPLKLVRCVRSLLTRITRSQFRKIVKESLRSKNFQQYVQCLNTIKFDQIELNQEDSKAIAFQIAQTLLLIQGIEIYSKREVANQFPLLEEFMYRKPSALQHLSQLEKIKVQLLNEMKRLLFIKLSSSLNIFRFMDQENSHKTLLENQSFCLVMDMNPGERCLHFSLDYELAKEIIPLLESNSLICFGVFQNNKQIQLLSFQSQLTQDLNVKILKLLEKNFTFFTHSHTNEVPSSSLDLECFSYSFLFDPIQSIIQLIMKRSLFDFSHFVLNLSVLSNLRK